MSARKVFVVSDGTGITAETFARALLNQFSFTGPLFRLPFVNDIEGAHRALRQINHAEQVDSQRPIVFTTLVHSELVDLIHNNAKALHIDMFARFVEPLEQEFGKKSNHRVGRFSDASTSNQYHRRMEAINYTLAYDDGQNSQDLAQSDVIVIGVSRSGKTPTSLYLAMQHGMKVANYPLIPEDFERRVLPSVLVPHRAKLFGLTIDPERLSEIRSQRLAHSQYASLVNCRYEVQQAEAMMRRESIACLSTTTKSIEEIAAIVLDTMLHKVRIDPYA